MSILCYKSGKCEIQKFQKDNAIQIWKVPNWRKESRVVEGFHFYAERRHYSILSFAHLSGEL